MALGFLCVFAEPGEQVSLDEFQDWYNNEHVPLRLNYLPSFLTGARYSCSDQKVPSWIALYDLDDTSAFQHDSYTRLRANRSAREADLVNRLSILDRRTCECTCDSGESTLTSSFKFDNPTPVIITCGFKGTTFDVRALRGVASWVRTRAFLVIDSLKTGIDVAEGSEAQQVPKYLVVHEFNSPIAVGDEGVKALLCLPGVEDIRSWQLYRAYPCMAQGNLPL